ncbi:MAG: sulfatase-like hydrolase/transferase [Armatimonadota bacterium]
MRGMPTDRRGYCCSALAVAAGMVLRGAWAAEESEQTNALLITADDRGLQLGCYGDRAAPTPNLDRLANEGARFINACVTQSSCSSIFTGLYPRQNGQVEIAHLGYSMTAAYPTIPSLLKATGYKTGVIGKIHVNPATASPFDWFSEVKPGQTREVAKVTQSVDRFLWDVGGQPFLMVNYMDPHRPFLNQVADWSERPLKPDEVEPFDFLGIDTPKVCENVAEYYNCVAHVEKGVDGCSAWAASRDASLANTLIREVYDRPGKPSAVELYDLQQDLVEFHNLRVSLSTPKWR